MTDSELVGVDMMLDDKDEQVRAFIVNRMSSALAALGDRIGRGIQTKITGNILSIEVLPCSQKEWAKNKD